MLAEVPTGQVLSLVANIASILGLIATLFAWLQAAKAEEQADKARLAALNAERAAADATKAIRHLEVAETLTNLGNRATELLALVESGDPVGARLRGRDLASDIVKVRLRWQRFLSKNSKTALARTVAQVQDIAETLALKGIPNNDEEKLRLLRFCHSVNQCLNAESGRMQGEIEVGEERVAAAN